MSLLKELVTEMASAGSTGATSIAATPGSLFGGGVVTPKQKAVVKGKKPAKMKMFRRGGVYEGKIAPSRRLAETLGLSTDETNFDSADVISKLDAAEKKADLNKDTVSFGLRDDQGGLIEVLVRADQADDFENALAAMLGQADENSDDANSAQEIAEVLYDLKNKFEIVDVKWGKIEGDEEEEQEVMPGEEGEGGEEGDMTADEQMPPEGMEDMADVGGEADATSALTQVIDLLKANAEAQKAEADARKAEANAKEAEAAAKMAAAKVKQEEEVLDMEAFYDKKKEEEKETKRIAKLAKYKHDKAREAEDAMGGMGGRDTISSDEEEENSSITLTPRQLADLIFNRVRAND